MKKSLFAFAIASLVFTTACTSLYAGNEKKEIAITQAEIDYEMSLVPDEYKGYYQAGELEKEIKKRLIEQKLLKTEAENLGYDKEEDYLRELEKTKANLLASRLVEEKIMSKVEVNDDDIRAYYDKNIDQFTKGERVKARHILINTRELDEKAKAEAKKKADKVLKRALAGEDFAKLANENSEGPTANTGGELGWFEKGRMVKPFEEAAFSGQKGQVYPQLVETMFGYHIILVEDKEDSTVTPFEEVKDQLQEQVLNNKRYEAYLEYVSGLKEKYGVE